MNPRDDGPLHLGRWANEILTGLSSLSGGTAYVAIFGMLAICGLGVPIPEDITLLAAGLLASSRRISLGGALAAGFLGVLSGDAVLFYLGRKYGRRIFLLPGFRRFFTAERVRAAEAKVKNHGPFICFVARFLPGLRSPTFAAAGAMGVSPVTFFALDGLAALISVPLWVGLAYWVGDNWELARSRAKAAEGLLLCLMLGLVTSYVVYRLWKRRLRARAGALVAPRVAELEDRK